MHSQLPKENNQDILTLHDVANTLKVSQATVLRWLKVKKIPGFFRIGRRWLIRKSDFDNFLQEKAKIDE